jgi:hypothetical protein
MHNLNVANQRVPSEVGVSAREAEVLESFAALSGLHGARARHSPDN